MAPLVGAWRAVADTPLGRVTCERRFAAILGGKFMSMEAHWDLPGAKSYHEHAVFGPDASGALASWSFTSDGKCSQGWLSEAADIHADALCFVSDMPAGRARQAYWPSQDGGIMWVVENQTKSGWNRFVEHHYLAL